MNDVSAKYSAARQALRKFAVEADCQLTRLHDAEQTLIWIAHGTVNPQEAAKGWLRKHSTYMGFVEEEA